MKYLLKCIVFALLCNLFLPNLYSQSADRSVIGTTGESSKTTTMTVNWTLGEPIIQSQQNSDYHLTQGFQQSDIVVTPVANGAETPEIDISVFPNPVSEILNIQWDQHTSGLEFRMVDLHGKTVRKGKGNQSQQLQLQVSNLAAGTYVLSAVKGDTKPLKTWRIAIVHQ